MRKSTSLILYSHSCVNASLGSVTTPKKFNGVVLTLTISVAFYLRHERTRILRLSGKRSYIGTKLWLEGLLGLEPRVVRLMLTMNYDAYLRGVQAVPRV